MSTKRIKLYFWKFDKSKMMNMENKDKLKEYMLKEIELIQFSVYLRHSDASG